MKYHLFFVTLLLSFSAIADSSKEAVKLFSTLQNKVQSGAELQCFEGDDPAELEACAVSLCGPAEVTVTAHISDANFDSYVQSGVRERFPEVDTPVKQIVTKKQKSLKKFIENFRVMQNSGKPIFDYENWTYEYQYFTYPAYSDLVIVTTDTTKPMEERLTIEVKPPKGSSETFIKGLEEYAETKKKSILQNATYGMYDGLYTKEESQTLVKDLWKSLYDTYAAEVAKNPDFMKDQKEQLEEYKDLDTFINGDEYTLGNTYTQLYELKNTALRVLGQPTVELYYGSDCSDNCKAGIKEYLNALKLNDMLKELEQKSSEYKMDDALRSCQAKLTLKGLKDSDKNKFLAHYPETKQALLDSAFAKYSSHSKKTFEKYLDEEMHLSFIREAPESIDTFLDDLKATAANEEAESAEESNVTLVNNLLNMRDWSDKTKMRLDFDPCDEPDGAFAAWDSFGPGRAEENTDVDPTKDNIAVSLFTCTHEPQGKGVVSHEMGHALSYAFSKDKLSEESKKEFLRVRKCVNESHVKTQSETSSFLTHKDDTLYSEEDMADVISYQAIDQAGPIFTCALLETNSAGTKFKDLALVNKHMDDSHSSPLLRVIREALYKRKILPATCKQVIEKNKDKFRFQLCL